MEKRSISRALALIMALSLLSTTAFAASFSQLQDAIDSDEATGSYEGISWSRTETGKNVTLNDNVSYGGDDAKSITVSSGNVTINMNGHTIDGSGCADDAIKVEAGGNLTLANDGTAEGNIIGSDGKNTVTVNGGVLTLEDGVNITHNSGATGRGVEIRDGGSFTMQGGEIKNNTAQNGGGVAVESGSFTMSGGTISSNTATKNAGGVYVSEGGTFTMSEGTIDKNNLSNADGLGGGVYVKSGSFTMSGGTISNHVISGTGGGVAVTHGGQFTMSETARITGNQAENGGGVHVESQKSQFTMNGGSIVNNVTKDIDGYSGGEPSSTWNPVYGGGVCVCDGAAFTMTNGEITGNSAVGKRGTGKQYGSYGGGVAVIEGGSFEHRGGKICNNSAEHAGADIVLQVLDKASVNFSLDDISEKGWTLNDGSGPITGWFGDMPASRWNHDNITGQFNELNEQLTLIDKQQLALKAAHGTIKVTVKYADENGNAIENIEDVTMDLTTKDGVYDVNDLTVDIDGYTFDSGSNDLPDAFTKDTTITLIYKKDATTPATPGDDVTIEGPDIPMAETPEVPGDVTIPDSDIPLADGSDVDAATTIEDDEVPLAGLLTLADLLEALREHEEIAEIELPEDFKWIDHELAQAIYWGLQEELVVDTEYDPLDPDELLTVGLMREVLANFVEIYVGLEDFEVVLESEDEDLVMDYIDMISRLGVFYDELDAALEAKAA